MNYNYTACYWFPTSSNILILPSQFWQIRFESYWLNCSKCRILVLLRYLHSGIIISLHNHADRSCIIHLPTGWITGYLHCTAMKTCVICAVLCTEMSVLHLNIWKAFLGITHFRCKNLTALQAKFSHGYINFKKRTCSCFKRIATLFFGKVCTE